MRLPFQARAVTRRPPYEIARSHPGAGIFPSAAQASANSISCPNNQNLCSCGSGKYCCCTGNNPQCHVDNTTTLCVCGVAF
jgi:hypothetical protein